MTIHLKSLVGLALCALVAPSRSAAEAPRAVRAANVIQGIGVSDAAGGVELEIRGTRAPSYTVFKLQDPPRLVVDLAGADISAVATPVPVGKAGVREVTTAQYKDDKSSVGRVIIALEGAAKYEVAPRGDAVVVKVASGEAMATSTPTRAATPASEDNVIARRVDEVDVHSPARAITGARARAGGVTLALDGEVARFEVIELQDPPRLALDLYGVTKAPRSAVALGGAFRQARFGRDAGKVRVVLDAAGELPRCEVRRVSGGLAVVPADAPALAQADAPRPVAQSAPAAPTGANAAATVIDDLRFSQAGGTARIELSGKAAHAVARPDARMLVLTLENARLAKKLERSLDATAFRGPVAMMSSFNQPGGAAKIVLSLRAEARDALVDTGSGLAWTISAAGAAAAADAPRASVAQAQAAGFTGEAPSYALSGAPQKREYTGRRITLDF
ncbi:MAG TPA: AMIN domain-containing protein, partial [Anaeromyxobacteraceae bacterium]